MQRKSAIRDGGSRAQDVRMANQVGSRIAREEWQRTFAWGAGLSFAVLASTFLLGFFIGAFAALEIPGSLFVLVAAGLVLIVLRCVPSHLRKAAQILLICCVPVCMLLNSHLSRLHAAPTPTPSKMRRRLHRGRLEFALWREAALTCIQS